MKTGKTLQGSANLIFDATDAVSHLVEAMYRNIAATAWPLGEEPEGPAPGIAGFVHKSVRGINGTVRTASNWCLGHVAPTLDRRWLPGPYRGALISVLNGICGDHLAASGNPLALAMQLRVLLPATDETGDQPATGEPKTTQTAAQTKSFANLLELEKRSVEVHPQPVAMTDPAFCAGTRLLVLVHGLCMNEREWTSQQHNHAEALAAGSDYTPVYVLYNSGLNVSTNGRALSEQLAGVLKAWPTAVESITFIGFSMGGLVTRSAMHIARNEGHMWLGKVDKAVYVGTPHHGAALERGGFLLQKSLTYSPYTAPLSALGKVRSAGITDLRHGNVQDDDWQHHDEHKDNADRRLPMPLTEGIRHYAIAATLSSRPTGKVGKLRADGLVHPTSALGKHDNPAYELSFPEGHSKVLHDLGHLAMLHDTRVTDQLQKWLG